MNEIIPPEMLNVPLDKIQLNLLTLFVASQILGRAYKGLRNEGGLRGLINGIWFGTNTPSTKGNEKNDS